ncbi:uncharacterized protein LOC110985704 [Acanthaster planci]|uniref:Uncharacterized protein LOC110985704 n=1 Tax=Acanthaster planci TaxID=133434 RepID=A0A8B7ZCP3_ACAPL|nr:uncharacterized protein LOC110985704 [Acanthaster planci]
MNRSRVVLFFSATFLLVLVHGAHGCRRLGTSGSIPPKGQGPTQDPISDVWLGRLPFFSYMCGWPNDTVKGGMVRRQVIDPFQLIPRNLDPIHTLVYFRGEVYEWGQGLLRSYARGTLGRDPHGCPIHWSLYGQSNCTSSEVKEVAASYLSHYGSYNLLSNNCHSFTERLNQKLLSGDCRPF